MNNNIRSQQNVILPGDLPVVLLSNECLVGDIKKEGRHRDDQSSNFKNLIP